MEINRYAPIVLRHQIAVFAPPKQVWERIAQVEFWARWHPDIGRAEWTDDEPMNPNFQAFKDLEDDDE